ncbi:MAG: hypothetical protein GY792_03710 [Gammaproteobacteria bacterium]|nr:hypothetical protein [Gammaproteobacteria bacterium]
MNKTFIHLTLAASLAITGAIFSAGAIAGPADDAIADAKDAQKQAKSVGGEWRDTGKMIKKAEKLLKAGKAKKAEELARAAEAQGMLGYMQAVGQTKDKLHI